mgnify:CR=1 FL=1
MRNDIKEKLRQELATEIKTEAQAVYILARIRKILEIDGVRGYGILKFYCNWALHAEIEDTDAVREILDGVVAGRDEPQINFFLFNPLHEQLNVFLAENNLPTNICDDSIKKLKFNRLLSQIYTDTPLIIKSIQKTEIIWKGSSGEVGYGGRFQITRLN